MALPRSYNEPLIAQSTVPSVPLPQSQQVPIDPPNPLPQPERPLPEQILKPLPPADELLRPSAEIGPGVEEPLLTVPGTITVLRFEVLGSTVFSPSDLAAATEPFTGRPITFAELLAARAAVTQLYVDRGYVTSAAYVPADQVIDAGVVRIHVLEGQLAAVNVQGLARLNPGYVSSRIAVASPPPLNVNHLLEGLQMLQQDPRIESLSAELAAGPQPGSSILSITVNEADSLTGRIFLDNGQSPSIGSVRRGVSLEQLNLSGLGDRLALTYSNTDGSNSLDASYVLPLNARNGTLELFYSRGQSWVIDEAFRILDIQTQSDEVSLGIRQPLMQTPTTELALGLQLSHESSYRTFAPPGFGRIGLPTLGARNGETRVSAIRFFQEWTSRGADSFFGVRSQFSLGTDWLGATLNPDTLPDSEFFSWQGQGQWVQRLAPDTLLIGRVAGQLADRPLLALEQFRLGGVGSVRGYRQDQILSDSGLFASLEARLPMLRIPEWESTVQVTPFVDYGVGWNLDNRPIRPNSSLLSVGVGLLWQVSNRATLRVDWGVPLIDPGPTGTSLQESGIVFSLTGALL